MSKVFWVEAPSKYVTLLFNVTEGVRTESIKTLAFRVALGCGKHFCDTDVSQVPAVSVSVCLVVLEGETLVESTEVNLNSLVTLRRPTGPITESRLDSTWYPPSLLQTVTVPMDRFLLESDLDLSTIHGIRVKIETEYPGELYLGQVCHSLTHHHHHIRRTLHCCLLSSTLRFVSICFFNTSFPFLDHCR